MTGSAQQSASAASPAAIAVGGGDGVAGSSFHALDDPPERRDRTWLQKLRFASGDAIYAISQRRALDFGDLLPLREVDATATCFARFHAAYERHARSLPRAMASAYGTQFALCGLGYLFVAANAAGAPVVVHHVVSAFSDAAATDDGALDVRGVSVWLAVFIVLRVANVAVATQVECCVNHIALRLTAAMKSLLFRKALRRDAVADASPDSTTTKPAELTNLVTSDTNGVLYAVLAAHNAWILPLQIAVITALLYRELDVAAFAGIAVVVASLGGNYAIARVMGRAYGALMRAKDARMATVKDAFGAIQIVKFNAWEPRFHATLTAHRATEIDRLAVYSYASAAGAFVLWSSPFFVSTVSFAVYALALGRPLTAAKVFTSMALFNALRDPLRDLPTTIQSLIQSRVSLQRLERFLAAPELDERGAFRGDSDAANGDATTAIRVDRASFAWGDTVVLRDVELTIQRGDLVVVHGPVGAGKSSLLSGLLGEMTATSGTARLHGRVAYYSQQPWIQNLTVRDNILFGTRFDAASYAAVLDACCLGPDLALLAAGDGTEIGEKGVNLSGGQKARVALARACYAALHGADIMLLDAPLAAVDAHVQQRIFAKCLCGLLRDKTVVLVTHSAEILASPLVNCRVEIDASGRISRVERSQQHVDRSAAGAAGAAGTEMTTDNGTPDVEVMADEKHQGENLHQPDVGRLVQDEGRRDGQIAGSVVQQYLLAAGGARFVGVLLAAQLAWQGFQIGSDVWLSHWTSREIDPSRVGYFTGVYASLAAAGATMVLLRGAVVAAMGLRAARALFRAMTDGLLHAPLRFFDTNPIGRILNRFADDMATIDVQLPTACATLLSALFSTLGALLTAAVAIQYVGLAVLPLVALYVRVAKGYVRTFCDVRRMLKVVNSPILSHLTQSEAGAPLLRAFGADYVMRALAELHVRIDVDNALWDTEIVLLQWFALRLQLLGCALVCLVVGSFVACARWFSPGLVGLAFTYALSIDGSLLTLLKAWSKAENALVSVERVAEYSDLPREGEQANSEAVVAVVVEPPASWPEHGAVVFEHVSFAYTPGGAPVLRDVSFSIRAHEKIGVVGRTGAGKSSLAMALLRVNELEAGRVLLDGRNTASVPLAALRGRIAIIPQSPVLLEGSLRHFLDPFNDYSDVDVKRMLAQVEMLPALEAMTGADVDVLALPLQANGENLSVGERQLLCVARALLRRCAVVVLDEATAAMDRGTEIKLARMLARELREVTQITIAHRLATVMDSDRILVMDRGCVIEYAAPATLLQDPTSAFSALVLAAKAE